MGDEEMDYFSLRYFSDIVDLFLTCKNIQESCTTSIFTNKDTGKTILQFSVFNGMKPENPAFWLLQ